MLLRIVLISVFYHTILDNILTESKATGEINGKNAINYLKTFGYISESTSTGDAQEARDITKNLIKFQEFAGLKQTGKFDEETLKLMNSPRCGEKDPIYYHKKRRRRYVTEGTKWKNKDLTYRIVNDPYEGDTKLSPELIQKTIKAAFQKWSRVADLTFTELKDSEADIMIKFASGEHGDDYKFDGRGKTLAHAFYPGSNIGIAGDAHFDLDEKFSLTEEDSTNFIWVTTHEFGHSLGLEHSNDVEAVMYPWYTAGRMGNIDLSKDDKRGIRFLYGKSQGRKHEPLVILPFPPRKECQFSFDTIFYDTRQNKIFAYKEFDFYIFNINGEKSKGPRTIRKRWHELNSKVRAAYTRPDGHTIFFTKYSYYEYEGKRWVSGPKFIEEYGLNAELREMDAVMSLTGSRETYFFKGDKFWKYDERKRKLLKDYPKLIKDVWSGLPDNIDAALHTPKGNTYFFKGKEYYQFDTYYYKMYPGYPKPIGPNWLGCSNKDNDNVLSTEDNKSNSYNFKCSYSILLLCTVLWTLVCKRY